MRVNVAEDKEGDRPKGKGKGAKGPQTEKPEGGTAAGSGPKFDTVPTILHGPLCFAAQDSQTTFVEQVGMSVEVK